jgi:hypothetical protein
LHFGFILRRLLRLGLSLVPALGLTACGSASLPRLSDLTEGSPPPAVAAAPPGTTTPPTAQLPPPAVTTGAARPSGSGVDTPPRRPARGVDVIVGFKGPTVILFGGEFGNEGERVAASALTVPLQVRNAASNASRVQIETAQGPRWVARSEITLGALERTAPSPR